jgi:DNA-directed RNA polymerase specialized sigma24 family protein
MDASKSTDLVPAVAVPEPTFAVTVRHTVRHTELLEAARKVGGVRALAKYLGIPQPTLSSWLNLRTFPLLCDSRGRRRGYMCRWPGIEEKLFELTGKKMTELFPNFVRLSGIFDRPAVSETVHEVGVSNWKALADKKTAEVPELGFMPSELVDLKEKIAKAMNQLTPRQQEVIRLRFGLDHDGERLTYDEIGVRMHITGQRVRELESNALFTLKKRTALFKHFLP